MYKTAEQIANSVVQKMAMYPYQGMQQQYPVQQQTQRENQSPSVGSAIGATVGSAALGGMLGTGASLAKSTTDFASNPRLRQMADDYHKNPKLYQQAARSGDVTGPLTGTTAPRRQVYSRQERATGRMMGRVGRRARRAGLLGAGIGAGVGLLGTFGPSLFSGE